MLESLFNKFIALQNFTKKRLQHRRFPMNIASFKNTYFEKHLRTVCSDSSYILHRKLNKIIQEPDWPCILDFCWFFLKHKITQFYLLSFVFIRVITRCHSLSLIIIFCYSLSFVVTRTTRCGSLYHSMSFVVT